MTGQGIIITIIVLAAVAYMARKTWKKYARRKSSSGGGCGCGCGPNEAKPKHVSLTRSGRTLRR